MRTTRSIINKENIINIRNNDDGIVGIVTAFLILGLIVVILTTVQTVYVPQIMEQREADHMETITDQFSQLKFAIDTHVAMKASYTPITTPFTLGSAELPYLSTSQTYGSLHINPDQCVFNFKSNDTEINKPLTGIEYHSSNAYFLEQNYVYETGALILSQAEGNTMTTTPSFFVIDDDNITLIINLYNISVIGEKYSIGGYDTYPIQTLYHHTEPPVFISDLDTLSITTSYHAAWEQFISSCLINAGLQQQQNYTIQLSENQLVFSFTDETIIDVEIWTHILNAQLAPGWIEV